MGWQPERGHHTRSRSLSDFEQKFKQGIVEKTIKEAKKLEDKVRVLEIGCGEGRVLMELRKLFPDIDLYGINKEPWPAMRGQESLIKTAEHYNIFSKREIGGIFLPEISFENAEKINFPCDYFDLIISHFAVPYIERKDRFLEEAWRTLKKGGSALIHMDIRNCDYPDFMKMNTPRFVIYKENKRLSFRKFMAEKGIHCSENYGITTIEIKKHSSRILNLGLEPDTVSSFDLSEIKKEHHGGLWGYRSVYKI